MVQQYFVNSSKGVVVNPNTVFILSGVCENNCVGGFVLKWSIEAIGNDVSSENCPSCYKGILHICICLYQSEPCFDYLK